MLLRWCWRNMLASHSSVNSRWQQWRRCTHTVFLSQCCDINKSNCCYINIINHESVLLQWAWIAPKHFYTLWSSFQYEANVGHNGLAYLSATWTYPAYLNSFADNTRYARYRFHYRWLEMDVKVFIRWKLNVTKHFGAEQKRGQWRE